MVNTNVLWDIIIIIITINEIHIFISEAKKLMLNRFVFLRTRMRGSVL